MPRLFKRTEILCALRMYFFFCLCKKRKKKGILVKESNANGKTWFLDVCVDEDCQMTGMNKCSFSLCTSELYLTFKIQIIVLVFII